MLPLPTGRIALLSVSAFASATSMRICDALQPKLATDFVLGLSTIAYVIVGFSVAYGVFQVAGGTVGERFGKFKVIIWANGLSALWAVLCALSPSFPMLLVARIFAGATAGAIIPLALAWVGDVVPYEERQPVLARFTLGQMFGIAGGLVLGGVAADHFSWRSAFIWIALIFFASTWLLIRSYRSMPAAMKHPPRHADLAGHHILYGLQITFAKPWTRVVMALSAIEGAAVYGALAFIAIHLNQTQGMSLTHAGALSMVFGAGGVLYVAVSKRFVARYGEVGLSAIGGVITGAGLITLGLFPSIFPALFIGLCGLGFYMMHNTLQVNATQMAPGFSGIGVSLFASAFFIGQSGGTLALGYMTEGDDLGAALAICGLAALGVGLCFAWLIRRRQQQQSRQAPERSGGPHADSTP